MSDLCVIVPSRGRPQNVRRLVAAWKDTGAEASLEIVIDNDDDSFLEEDIEAIMTGNGYVSLSSGPRIRLGPTLNREAVIWADCFPYVGFMGDDHLPRTPEWDKRICDALKSMGTGIVYGNDLFQGIALPTSVFMTSNIVRTLGYMCPPTLLHLFIDNAWKAWGQQMGPRRLLYLPEVIIEHIHPHAGGKAPMDAGYAEVNGGEMYDHCKKEWDTYQLGQMVLDVQKLRELG